MCCNREEAIGLELNDMGDSYLFFFIERKLGGFDPYCVNGERRVVLIGSSFALLASLLTRGCRVLHIDKDPAETEDKRRVLSVNLSEKSLQGFESAAIDIEKEGAVLRQDDIVCFVRSLHHMSNPSEALQRVRGQVRDVIVCDASEDLLKEAENVHEEEYAGARALYAGDADTLDQITAEQRRDTETNEACFELLRGHGLKDEEAVRDFLTRSGFDLENSDVQFYYRLRCPCGGWSCQSMCTYWFLIT